ncbi:MAG: hypothetical protein OHK0017_02350 [Patescibacteria group bacterium]
MLYLAIILVIVIYFKGFENTSNIFNTIQWLEKSYRSSLNVKTQDESEKPEFIILLPMLREQRTIKATVHYFAQLKYPLNKYKIIVVTTEKENREKEEQRYKLTQLATSIYKKENKIFILEKFAGLFNLSKLENLYDELSDLTNITQIENKLVQEYNKYPTTHQLALQYKNEINEKLGINLVEVLHFPNSYGKMSDQLNFAINKLEGSGESFVAIFNADSRPDPETLNLVNYQINQYGKQYKCKVNIIQQSSIYTLNIENFKNNFRGAFLRAAAIYQTYWSLAFEIPRFRKQSVSAILARSTNKKIEKLALTKLSHCVGHGLFIRLKMLRQNKLPTETVNEDLPFGFLQSYMHEPIFPLCLLENSESPETIHSHFNQKKVWFWSYLEYVKVAKSIYSKIENPDKLRLVWLTFQGVARGLVWLSQSLVFIIPLIIFLIISPIWSLVWVLGIMLYWVVPSLLIHYKLPLLHQLSGTNKKDTDPVSLVSQLIMGLLVVLTNSLGPVMTIIQYLKVTHFNTPLIKYKTER